uniref:Uncharacterized protein n=1 Tax=Cucumis melo TaxID=3656 RepID=A0A9I9E5T9_CUCME
MTFPPFNLTFYQPWKDYSLELTNLQKMDEVHACQTLQLVISNILSKKPLDLQFLLPQDIEISRVFEWERNLIRTQDSNPQQKKLLIVEDQLREFLHEFDSTLSCGLVSIHSY